MSPKELLYIEDALGNTKEMQTVCKEMAQNLQDETLKNFVTSLSERERTSFTNFYSLLNN